jgi:hypothetical protein
MVKVPEDRSIGGATSVQRRCSVSSARPTGAPRVERGFTDLVKLHPLRWSRIWFEDAPRERWHGMRGAWFVRRNGRWVDVETGEEVSVS